MEIRSIIELTLAINCLLLSIEQYRLSKRLRDLTNNFPHSKITHARRELQQENKILRENAEHNDKGVDKVNWENMLLKKKNKQLKDKLSKIETLIINHNCDSGDIYYKYNSKFLKSELKQRILEILYEQGSDSNE